MSLKCRNWLLTCLHTCGNTIHSYWSLNKEHHSHYVSAHFPAIQLQWAQHTSPELSHITQQVRGVSLQPWEWRTYRTKWNKLVLVGCKHSIRAYCALLLTLPTTARLSPGVTLHACMSFTHTLANWLYAFCDLCALNCLAVKYLVCKTR